MNDRRARAIREHPEGGWRNPLWRSMALASIVIMLAIAVCLVEIVVLAIR